MKHLIQLFACCISFQSFAQKLELNEVDEFTGTSKKRTKLVQYNSSFGQVFVLQVAKFDSSHYAYFAHNPKLGCAGDVDNYVIFLFDDGSTLELKEDLAEIDCGGFPKSCYKFDPKDFQEKNISKIRLRMGSGPVDAEWMMKRSKFTFNQLVQAVQ